MSEVRNKFATTPTLCWDCANATGGCNWSDELQPVEGWKIIPTMKKAFNHPDYPSCIVLECPEFKRDAIRSGMKRYKE